MSYAVELAGPAARKIAGWNLSSHLQAEILKQLDELGVSPIRHLEHLQAPLVVAYGACETPEFQRQNREFAAAVKAAGKPVTFLVGQGYNHFEMFETLGNPYGLVGRAMLQLMSLKTPAAA